MRLEFKTIKTSGNVATYYPVFGLKCCIWPLRQLYKTVGLTYSGELDYLIANYGIESGYHISQ